MDSYSQDTSAIALQRGVVGGLPENLDAYPHPGAVVTSPYGNVPAGMVER